MKTQSFKLFWKKLRKNWSRHFSFVIRNEKNLSEVFKLRLTPRKIFVLGTTTFLLITTLTALLIAFTPLRVYVPGYTNPIEYNLYKKMLIRVDSIEKIHAIQKVYLDNFVNLLNDIVVFEEMNAPVESEANPRVTNKEKAEQATKQVNEIAEQLILEITERSTKNYIPLNQHLTTPEFAFTMPTLGTIVKLFSIPDKHLGIDIENEKGTLITSIADGVVIFTEASENEGNIMMVQHSGNIISIYKNVDKFLKKVGTKIKNGDPIATMGNKGTESPKPYLHFEIWYNGSPVNPTLYFLGN